MPQILNSQTALVTGAASGIGAGVARTLGAAGAAVVINYVTNPAADAGCGAGHEGGLTLQALWHGSSWARAVRRVTRRPRCAAGA